MIRLLILEQVLLLHKRIIEQPGGSTGIRNQGLLESALGFSLIPNAGRGLQPRPKRLMFTVIQKICVGYG